jgi:citrate lyase beta subunit
MITWCGDPGWAAWMMTGGRSPAARWARRRLCEAERDAAVIEHAALRIRLDAEFLAARCIGIRMALLTVDAEDLIASTGGRSDRLRRGGRRPMCLARPMVLQAGARNLAAGRCLLPKVRPPGP